MHSALRSIAVVASLALAHCSADPRGLDGGDAHDVTFGDGRVDAGPCRADASASCYTGPEGTLNVGACRGGTQRCLADGGWGSCTGEVLPAAMEICGNQIDDDCNGMVDEGCASGCGNHVCDTGETCSSCPADCGDCATVCSATTCGGCTLTAGCGWCGGTNHCMPCNGASCAAPSTCSSGWSSSQPQCPAGCGDGVCNNGENCGTCPADCNTCEVVCATKTDCGTCAGTPGCGWCGGNGVCMPCLGNACTPSGTCTTGWSPNPPDCTSPPPPTGYRLFIAYDGSTSNCRSSTDGAFQCLLGHTAFPSMAAAWPYGRPIAYGASAVLQHDCSFHMGTDATTGDDSATFQCIEDQTGWDLHDDDVLIYFPTFGGCNSGRNQWHIPVNSHGTSVSVEVGLNFTGGNCGCQTAIASHEVYEASAQWNAADCCNGQNGCAPQPAPWGWYTLSGCPSGVNYTVATIEPVGHLWDASACTRLTPH